MCVRVFARWTPGFFLLSLALTLTAPALLKAQVFQWTDPRGVIHFTDNASSIPESIKSSTRLIVRMDMRPTNKSIETTPAVVESFEEPTVQAEPAPSEPQPAKTPAPIIHYNPQQVTIVVVNTVVRRPKRKCFLPEGCKPVFRPSFDDRRFIHPSVFDGSPRQYVQPK